MNRPDPPPPSTRSAPASAPRAERRAPETRRGRALWCIAQQQAQAPAVALLEAACRARGVAWRPLDTTPGPAIGEASVGDPGDGSGGCDGVGVTDRGGAPAAGDALLDLVGDPGTDALARRLWQPGVGTLQRHGAAPRVPSVEQIAASGVRTPRRVAPAPTDTPVLLDAALELGAYPVLLRLPGNQGGRGVLRLDSAPSLVSVREVLPAEADLVEYVEHAIAWRLYVVAGAIAGAEAWRPAAHDFRSNVGGLRLDAAPRDAAAERAALAACDLLGLGFAGVDVMIDRDGRPWVAEVNSPCWFADAQAHTGLDLAGRIVDALLDAAA